MKLEVMKLEELELCSGFIDQAVNHDGTGSVVLSITLNDQAALAKLSKLVSGLKQTQEQDLKKSMASAKQQEYLDGFEGDSRAATSTDKRRGEIIPPRIPMTREQCREKLRMCIRKTIMANRFAGKSQRSAVLDQELANLTSWEEFNLNAVARLSQKRPLEFVAFAAFERYNLINKLSISTDIMGNFLAQVERHYLPNPYHCSTHAADVTQNLVCLLETDKISLNFTDLEVVAMLISTAVHDVGHPGWTNTFLISTQDEQAILYNDISVNENLSLSIAFKILQDESCNIFRNLSSEDYFYVRRLIVDIVLATDMANHSSVVEQFSMAMALEDTSNWESWKPSSRTLAMKMLVHCADLANPCKPPASAGSWGQAVYNEFFRQGGAERAAGLPVTPLFDKSTVSIHASQRTFVQFVVMPCYTALEAIAPKIAAQGLSWMNHNTGLWDDIRDRDLQHGMIGFDTEGVECEEVVICPKANTCHLETSAWGNTEMLTTLLNSEGVMTRTSVHSLVVAP